MDRRFTCFSLGSTLTSASRRIEEPACPVLVVKGCGREKGKAADGISTPARGRWFTGVRRVEMRLEAAETSGGEVAEQSEGEEHERDASAGLLGVAMAPKLLSSLSWPGSRLLTSSSLFGYILDLVISSHTP